MHKLTASAVFVIALCSFEQSVAQLCFSSSPIHTVPKQQIAPTQFLESETNLKLIKDEIPYTRLIVGIKYLNVRDNHNFGNIVGTVFQGQKVPIFSRQGKWVAITRDVQNTFHEAKISWVHIDYLTPNQVTNISGDEFISKCSLEQMAEHLEDVIKLSECESVRKFLKQNNSDRSSTSYKLKLLN